MAYHITIHMTFFDFLRNFLFFLHFWGVISLDIEIWTDWFLFQHITYFPLLSSCLHILDERSTVVFVLVLLGKFFLRPLTLLPLKSVSLSLTFYGLNLICLNVVFEVFNLAWYSLSVPYLWFGVINFVKFLTLLVWICMPLFPFSF